MSSVAIQLQPVLIDGQWRESQNAGSFQASNPATREKLSETFPVSSWTDCDAALSAAVSAFRDMRKLSGEKIAQFLEAFADEIESKSDLLVAAANTETALPVSPRLKDVELPRTTGQLRQAASAARTDSWRQPTIDTATGIRSCLGPIGPVCVFGPNNFPFAFGSISGGDFAAAIAAGNPVIGKANSSHPETTRIFGEAVLAAIQKTNMPSATVQLIYRTSHDDGERLVSDPRVAATGYTGSRHAGLKLKAAAESAGKQIYLELSSCNPVFILPGAVAERGDEIVTEFTGSCLMGTGQFCTNPSLIVMMDNEDTAGFIEKVAQGFADSAVGTLLSEGVQSSLIDGIQTLVDHGAELLTGGKKHDGSGFSVENSVLKINGEQFLNQSDVFQSEVFGNATLFVIARNIDEAERISDSLEGNLTGCVYSDTGGNDDADYQKIEPSLRSSVGRLLNDKMPTGVAVSPAMNHGGPFPATGNPHFTAVGMPGSIGRFTALHCYDNVRPGRLPECLRDGADNSDSWRIVDGNWTQGDIQQDDVQ